MVAGGLGLGAGMAETMSLNVQTTGVAAVGATTTAFTGLANVLGKVGVIGKVAGEYIGDAFSGIDKQVRNTNKEIERLTSVQQGLIDRLSEVDEGTDRYKELQTQLTHVGKQIQVQTTNAENLGQQWKSVAGILGIVANAFITMDSAMIAVQRDIRDIRRETLLGTYELSDYYEIQRQGIALIGREGKQVGVETAQQLAKLKITPETLESYEHLAGRLIGLSQSFGPQVLQEFVQQVLELGKAPEQAIASLEKLQFSALRNNLVFDQYFQTVQGTAKNLRLFGVEQDDVAVTVNRFSTALKNQNIIYQDVNQIVSQSLGKFVNLDVGAAALIREQIQRSPEMLARYGGMLEGIAQQQGVRGGFAGADTNRLPAIFQKFTSEFAGLVPELAFQVTQASIRQSISGEAGVTLEGLPMALKLISQDISGLLGLPGMQAMTLAGPLDSNRKALDELTESERKAQRESEGMVKSLRSAGTSMDLFVQELTGGALDITTLVGTIGFLTTEMVQLIALIRVAQAAQVAGGGFAGRLPLGGVARGIGGAALGAGALFSAGALGMRDDNMTEGTIIALVLASIAQGAVAGGMFGGLPGIGIGAGLGLAAGVGGYLIGKQTGGPVSAGMYLLHDNEFVIPPGGLRIQGTQAFITIPSPQIIGPEQIVIPSPDLIQPLPLNIPSPDLIQPLPLNIPLPKLITPPPLELPQAEITQRPGRGTGADGTYVQMNFFNDGVAGNTLEVKMQSTFGSPAWFREFEIKSRALITRSMNEKERQVSRF